MAALTSSLSIRERRPPQTFSERTAMSLNAFPVFIQDDKHHILMLGNRKTAAFYFFALAMIVGLLTWLFTTSYTYTTIIKGPSLDQYDAMSTYQPSCPCSKAGFTTFGAVSSINVTGYAATHSLQKSLCGAVSRFLTALKAGVSDGSISTEQKDLIIDSFRNGALDINTPSFYNHLFIRDEYNSGVTGMCFPQMYLESVSLAQVQTSPISLDFLPSRIFLQTAATTLYKQGFTNEMINFQALYNSQPMGMVKQRQRWLVKEYVD